MLARRDDDAEPRAGLDIDMRIDAALADELQLGQPLKQRRADLRPLAEQHQDFGILQALGQSIRVLHMIGPHRDIVAVELPETRQRAQRVEIIVEDGDFHAALFTLRRPPAQAGKARIIAIKRNPFAAPLDRQCRIPGIGNRGPLVSVLVHRPLKIPNADHQARRSGNSTGSAGHRKIRKPRRADWPRATRPFVVTRTTAASESGEMPNRVSPSTTPMQPAAASGVFGHFGRNAFMRTLTSGRII